MKTFLCLASLLFFHYLVYSQESKIKYGKIDPTDLTMVSFPADTEANALILSDVGFIKYDPFSGDYNLIRYHHVVIKILNKRGIEQYGDVEIPYYSHERASFVSSVRAMVHLQDGTEIKLKNEEFVDERVNDYYSRKKIAFPSVAVGTILEYEYQLSSKEIVNPVDWFFQSDTPIRYAELKVSIPDWFDYVVLTQGPALIQSSRSQERDPVTDIIHNYWTFIHKDVPALKEEKFITTMEDYYSRIQFRLNTVKIPNQVQQSYMNSWEEVSETLWAIPAFGYQLNNKRPGELVLEAAGISPADTNSQFHLASRIYNYINQNIEPNKSVSIGTYMEIPDILKKRTASSGNLNKLMLAALLQLGIEAYPVLISTRDNGHVFEEYPFVDQFNHMLVMAKLDDKITWIDLGNSKRPIGYIAARSLNSRGWVAAKKNPYWTDLPQLESKSILVIKGQLNSDGFFNGEVEGRFTGFHAVNQRVEYEIDSTEYFKEQLTYSSSPVLVKDIEIINENDIYKPFQIKGKISDLQLGDVGNNKLYLSPLSLAEFLENPFKQENREYPVEYPYSEDYSVIFDMVVPENFTVEALPKSAKYTTEQNGVQVSMQTSNLSGKIGIVSKFIVKQLYFDPEDYPVLKNIYDLRKEIFTEQIVLTKAL